jgi:hypothetical protein
MGLLPSPERPILARKDAERNSTAANTTGIDRCQQILGGFLVPATPLDIHLRSTVGDTPVGIDAGITRGSDMGALEVFSGDDSGVQPKFRIATTEMSTETSLR